MDCNYCAKVAQQSPCNCGVAEQHAACRRAQKGFHAAHLCVVDLLKRVEIGVGGPDIEAVVGWRYLGGLGIFCLEPVDGGGGRRVVGHVHVAGHTAGHGSTALAGNVGLVGHAWLAKVHVVVDHAGHDVGSFHVDALIGVFHHVAARIASLHLGDDVVVEHDIAMVNAPFVYHCAVVNKS